MAARPAAGILPLLFKVPPTHRLIGQMLMGIGYAAILYWDLNSVFTPPFLTVVLVAAWLRGGRDERRMALIFGASAIAVYASRYCLGVWSQTAIFAIDVVTLGLLLWASARAERLWPLWITALQILGVTIHLIYFIAPSVVDLYSYLAAVGIGSATQILAMAFGVWDAWAERRAHSRGDRGLFGRGLGPSVR